ncbi:PREDICTED: keratin-associated protein 27-1-like [Elephantulus edwardii]|uniref:keratin-associated protein 27-1-like n=1 Tax=Elephantulus edwardii TaxID=28737 RepID=UPI0003F0A215|nr:PREDICTED: keratin-associated protein 27-1-like [Elephantulus edwardii]
MSLSSCHSLRSFYNAPPLSAIVHGSDLVSFEDGFCLPSSYHSRTWLLDSFQETCSETTSCQLTNCDQNVCSKDCCLQSACLPRAVQTMCTNTKTCERTTCQEGAASAAECVTHSYKLENSQQTGHTVWSCQPGSYLAKSCPPKNYVAKNCQSLECQSSQMNHQGSESQILESSSTYEPPCCVTGGLQLPSK